MNILDQLDSAKKQRAAFGKPKGKPGSKPSKTQIRNLAEAIREAMHDYNVKKKKEYLKAQKQKGSDDAVDMEGT